MLSVTYLSCHLFSHECSKARAMFLTIFSDVNREPDTWFHRLAMHPENETLRYMITKREVIIAGY